MAKHIVFMRHGQSEANAAHLWQGTGSSPLTEKGRSQARSANSRLARRQFARVISSDLERAVTTAQLAGFEPVQRPIWREGDLGAWEGLTFAQVIERFGDELRALNDGVDLKLGGTGESAREVSDRALAGTEELLAELDDGESALVVSHGGLINGLLRRLLDVPRGGRRIGIPANTSFTELSYEGDSVQVRSFNDSAHLGPVNDWTREHMRNGLAVVELIRHGVTDANQNRIVQGHADWGLNDEGRTQAAALGPRIGPVDAVYASDLGRAAETAGIVFDQPITQAGALREIDMGEWNGMAWNDIPRDDLYRAVYEERRDVPRGTTGERWSDLAERVQGFVRERALDHEGERVAMVSHGGSIRAMVGSALGLDHAGVRQLGFLSNTAVSQVVMLPDGPMVASYNNIAHLERDPVA